MLIQETLENGIVKSYSDNGFFIQQVETGELYEEAIDLPNKHSYIETDIEIPIEIEDIEIYS